MEPTYELKGKPKLLIVDGAGTLFDPGSVVPAYAFQRAFAEKRLEVDLPTICKYMGRQKKQHINLLLNEPGVLAQFQSENDREPDDNDIEALYSEFKNQLYPSADQTKEIPGVKEAAFKLREAGIPLVMTTGYDRTMVDETRKKLPWLDDVLTDSYTSSDVESGRPAPDMIYKAMEAAGVTKVSHTVKIGDTKVDMEAPDNVCMPGIIVTSGSIRSIKDAETINANVGRKHLVLPSLVEVIRFTLDGTLADKINKVNK